MKIDIKKAVYNDRKVTFAYFRDNALWYKTEEGQVFPVPLSDTGGATFNYQEKAILLMRYMRKFNDSIDESFYESRRGNAL